MPNSTTEEIKSRLNLVEVVSSYIPLKKSGTNYKANCPFHKEKSASFTVSQTKQIWHCFGCGEGGDVFGFVMKYENLEFAEALKILAERAGVELPKYSKQNLDQDKKKESLIAISELSARFFQKVLEQSKQAESARKYLKERGLLQNTISKWQIGFAPEGFHVLQEFLGKKSFDKKDLLGSGVLSKNDRGEMFDRFVNRVTFPIKNYTGDIVGFTARILDSDAKAAKYINSPETEIYSKGKVIFGLYQAKQSIRKDDFAVIVEGNMDVITAHQAGFENVVGSSGTAFTFEQLQVLSRLTKNLKFAFDTDQAGITATKRAVELALQQGFNVFIVKIENAKDPDELIKKNPKAFSSAIKEAPLYLDYFFEKCFENYDPSSVQNKKRIIAELLPFVQKLSDPLEANHYAKILAQRLGTTEKTIYELLAKEKVSNFQAQRQVSHFAENSMQANKVKNASQASGEPSQNAPLIKTKSQLLQERLLGFALFKKDFREELLSAISPQYFHDNGSRFIFEKIQSQNPENMDEFIGSLEKGQDLAKLALFMVESEYSVSGDQQNLDREFKQILRDFKTNSVKTEMNALAAEMVLAEQKKDKQKLQELNKRFVEISKKVGI